MRLFSRKSKIQSTAQNVDKATSSDDYLVQFPQFFTLLVLEQARLPVKKNFLTFKSGRKIHPRKLSNISLSETKTCFHWIQFSYQEATPNTKITV